MKGKSTEEDKSPKQLFKDQQQRALQKEFLEKLQEEMRVNLIKACLLYTSPSPRD